ncbi:MAG: hypothetical protein AB2L24_05010 [Mangrovibacterium sp.]
MKRTNLFTILFLSLCFVFIVSCSDDDELVENKAYELKEISWTLKDGDGQEIIEKQLPEQVFRNEGNTRMPVSINPLEGLEGTSRFYSDDAKTFTELNGTDVLVSVPSEVELLSFSGCKYFVGGVKVPFILDEASFPFSTEIEVSAELTPYTEMRYGATVYLKKITATYYARFGEKDGMDSYDIEGKWTGIFFHTIESFTLYDDIKQ